MAAADERIDDLVNRSKVKGDIVWVTDLLDKVMSSIEKINKMKIDIGGAKGMAETARAAETAVKAAEDMAKSTAKVKQVNEELEKSLQGVNRQWLANAADIKENIALQVQYEAELRKVKALLASAESAGNTTKIVEYRQKALELKAAISDLDRTTKYQAQSNNALEDTFKKMSLELGNMRTLYKSLGTMEKGSEFGIALKRNIDQLDAEVKKIDASLGNFQRNVGNYKSGFNGLGQSINQITRELPAFTYSLQTGFLALSNNFPMLFDEVGKVRAQIKASRAEIIANAKAVALQTRENLLATGATLAHAAAEQKLAYQTALANAQLGSQTVFKALIRNIFSLQTALSLGVLALTLYGDKIAKWISGLFGAEKAAKTLSSAMADINNELAKGGGGYADAVDKISKLEKIIQLAKNGTLEHSVATKEFNKEIHLATGEVTSLAEAEQWLIDHKKDYLQMMFEKEIAAIAYKKAADAAVKAIAERSKSDEESTDYISSNLKNSSDSKIRELYKKQAEKNREVVASEFDKDEKLNKEIADKATERQAALAKKIGVLFTDPDKKDRSKQDKVFRDNGEARQNSFETQKAILEDIIKTNDSIVKNEEAAFLLRVQAAKKYQAARIALENKSYDFQIEDINAKEKEDIKQAEREYKNENEKNKAIASIRDAARTARELAETKHNISLNNLSKEYQNEYLGQLDAFLHDENDKRAEAAKRDLDTELTKAESKYIEAETTLDDRYAKEIISAKNHAKKKKQIERDYQIESARLLRDYNVEILTIQIEEGKKQIEEAEKVAKATGNEEDWSRLAAARAKIAQLEVKLAKYVAEAKKKANKEASDQAEADEKTMEEKLEYLSSQAVSVFSSVSDIIGARYEREKNLIEQQIELIEKKKLADIDAINASADTEEKKAARIKIVEAKAQSDREQLERRQRLLDQKKARFQKYVAIATIIQETAVAVMKAFADYGWVGAIAAGALGAAKLAAVVATPIPQYKRGTENHPGGEYIAGDGGKKELVLEPSGKAFVTADKPTLYNSPPGTKVYPDAQRAMDAVNARAKSYMPFVIIKKEGEPIDMSAILSQKLDRLNNSIKNKKELHLSITRYGQHLSQQSGYNFRDYLNQNLQSS